MTRRLDKWTRARDDKDMRGADARKVKRVYRELQSGGEIETKTREHVPFASLRRRVRRAPCGPSAHNVL